MQAQARVLIIEDDKKLPGRRIRNEGLLHSVLVERFGIYEASDFERREIEPVPRCCRRIGHRVPA